MELFYVAKVYHRRKTLSIAAKNVYFLIFFLDTSTSYS